LFLGGGGFIYIVGGNWGWLVKPAPTLSGCLIVLGKFGLGAIECLSLGGGGFIYIVNDRDYSSFAPNSFPTDCTKSSRGINRGIFTMI
jgi:hypothetical protein